MNDTIAAISTALGVGAISIIRVSGSEAIEIVNKLFKGKDLTKVDTHTILYGHIINNDEVIDEVLVSVMKAPKTFTTEDIVEINSHGGISTTNKVLELLLTNGWQWEIEWTDFKYDWRKYTEYVNELEMLEEGLETVDKKETNWAVQFEKLPLR